MLARRLPAIAALILRTAMKAVVFVCVGERQTPAATSSLQEHSRALTDQTEGKTSHNVGIWT